jgi:two-component system NtrC family response regulator
MEKVLLIIEDDPGLQNQMKWCFDEGVTVVTAQDGPSAVEALRRHEPQVVTLDLGLPPDPGGSSAGFELLGELLNLRPTLKVIVITGQEDEALGVKAIGLGAQDFYHKPIEPDVLSFVVERAFRVAQLEAENLRLRRQAAPGLCGIVGDSPLMVELCRTIEKIAPTDLAVLIHGETGTGKELVARALHSLGGRAEKPFCAINCAAIPENLLESELFGYEKGAFTGATRQKKGKIEMAQGGTLFLDEIGDMPLPLQAKMLRFLQERVLERIGGHDSIPVDVRVVCATHRDLMDMIAKEGFREDLYYRIGELSLEIPPIRAREGDLMLLAYAFLEQFSQQQNKKIKRFSPEAVAAIENYPWRGNVRELESKVKRAIILADSNVITTRDLGLAAAQDEAPLNLREVRERAEKEAILKTLNGCKHNLTQAAKLLGVTRPTLYNLLSRYGIEADN